MYLNYYGFKEFPFSLVSDPRFLYLSEDHQRVKAYIDYAMNIQDSFVVCTGEIGAGKTTLINDALINCKANAVVAQIQAGTFNEQEFMQMILLEFGIEPYEFNKVQMIEKLKQYLFAQQDAGKKVFLFVDEAHLLQIPVLENIRYLSDLEKNQRKLLSVILVGQPELNDVLERPEMEHLLQRVRLRFHIKALQSEDIAKYINHRISVAGARSRDLFEESCISMIHQYTGGRLRLINTLCDYALMYCFVEKLPMVTQWVIQKAANELQWESYEKRFGQHQELTTFKVKSPVKSQKLSAKVLLKREGKNIGTFELSKESMSIGRQIENDIPIEDHKVSRNHAQLILQGNQVYLHDLNSTNGTFVNQKKINVHQLVNGDEFSIGDFYFSYIEKDNGSQDAIKNDTRQRKPLEIVGTERTRIRPVSPMLSLVDN